MLDRFNFIAIEVNTFEKKGTEIECLKPLFSKKGDH